MQLTDMADRLRALGLSEKQAKVFTANTFLGPATAQTIAEQAGINRPSTYDILEELAEIGLVSRSNSGNKTLFIAAGGAGLVDWLTRQSQELIERQETLQQLLPSIQEMEHQTAIPAPTVRFVHGKEAIDAMWSYVARKAQPGAHVYSITSDDETRKMYPTHLGENPRLRAHKRLVSKQLYYNSEMMVPSDPTQLKETKRLGRPLAGELTLYEDKAVLLSYGRNGSGWTGILVEDADIVATMRQLIELAWISSDDKP